VARIIVSNLVTLDGFIADAEGRIDWFRVDDEFREYSWEFCGAIGAFLFGRRTYELMASYWPSEVGEKDDPFMAKLMNDLPKIVVSKSMPEPEWRNTRVIRGRVPESIAELKEKIGGDIALLGSGQLVASLLPLGLIDELRILVHPTILGGGQPEFARSSERIELKFLYARPFRSGSVMLAYQPAGPSRG
jgi:dihydrofolate reductase